MVGLRERRGVGGFVGGLGDMVGLPEGLLLGAAVTGLEVCAIIWTVPVTVQERGQKQEAYGDEQCQFTQKRERNCVQ